jgi:hypothetical protein
MKRKAKSIELVFGIVAALRDLAHAPVDDPPPPGWDGEVRRLLDECAPRGNTKDENDAAPESELAGALAEVDRDDELAKRQKELAAERKKSAKLKEELAAAVKDWDAVNRKLIACQAELDSYKLNQRPPRPAWPGLPPLGHEKYYWLTSGQADFGLRLIRPN